MPSKKIFVGIVALALVSCGHNTQPEMPRLNLAPGSEREIAYTDKGDAFWVTRTGGYQSSPWHGLTASKRQYFEDLFIYANGTLLPRELAEVRVDPVQLVRDYPDLGIRETWTLLDGQRSLLVQLEARDDTEWTLQPAVLGGRVSGDFRIKTSPAEMQIELTQLKDQSNSYSFLGLRFSPAVEWLAAQDPGMALFNAYLTPQARQAESREMSILISLSDTITFPLMDPDHAMDLVTKRHQRILAISQVSSMVSNDTDLNAAVAWAHASLDALIMKQTGAGIYAGLPWFDDYWGRDVFISYPGAVLLSGKFEEARAILLSFATLQNMNPDDMNYGRVPNRAQPEDIIYNTTDGTPWFVRAVWDYYRYSGDEEFLQQIYPAIHRAYRGAVKNWCDDSGLLRHADADTWMDAKGPDGPWSPRGDRAIEIQFLWRDQLEITARLAQHYGDNNLVQECQTLLAKLTISLDSFRKKDTGVLVDHLNRDGSQDDQIRPNVFLVSPLFNQTCDWSTFSEVAPQLITRQGVLSLSQNDPQFHPFHHRPGLYVQDAAYHNGIIWTWNSAAAVSASIRFHQYQYAETLFKDLSHHLLNRGAVGTIAELTDAWPSGGSLALSGTFSQAWSLAEYLRVFYQDILGVQPDLTQDRMRLSPRLPDGVNQVRFKHPYGNDNWEIQYLETDQTFELHVDRREASECNIDITLRVGDQLPNLAFKWTERSLHLRYEKQMGQWTVPASIPEYFRTSAAIDIPINGLPFCVIDTSLDVPALQGPQHRLLTENEVVLSGPLKNIFLSAADPEGDDRGDKGRFTYPKNSQFEAGIADILLFQLGEEDSDVQFSLQFRKLADPGWHPEYGYQLTYCALGIDYPGLDGSREIGKNAQATFKGDFKADEILYLSSSLLLVDAEHIPLAEYMPRRVAGAIGSAKSGTLHFKLPGDLFSGNLHEAEYQIAVGFQDDHGGAGLGDFRPVDTAASGWIGGGKDQHSESNIYDWLLTNSR